MVQLMAKRRPLSEIDAENLVAQVLLSTLLDVGSVQLDFGAPLPSHAA